MKDRYYLLDALRGLSMLSMVAFHFCYDYFMIYGVDTGWYRYPASRIWQLSICCSFILLSGYVWHLGGNMLKRGLIVSGYGLIISMVTAIAMPSEVIWWGILSFMGGAMLLTVAVDKAFNRGHSPFLFKISYIVIALFLFFFTRGVMSGYMGMGDQKIYLPAWLYGSSIGVPFGFIPPGFRSSDYFPLLPWYFLYLCGYFAGMIRPGRRMRVLLSQKIPVLSALGRYAIPIYLIHQPLCMAVCMLIFRRF